MVIITSFEFRQQGRVGIATVFSRRIARHNVLLQAAGVSFPATHPGASRLKILLM